MGSKHGECALCGAELNAEPKHFINCRDDLDETHGKDCNCWLPVGSGCWRKIDSVRRSEIKKGDG